MKLSGVYFGKKGGALCQNDTVFGVRALAAWAFLA
jgi:hypothetical protein